jgi:hypothetical protein
LEIEIMPKLVSSRAVLFAALLVGASAAPGRGQTTPPDYQQVLTTLGKSGDFKDNVLKVNIPRNDVAVTVAGGPAEKLASGFKAAVNELGKHGTSSAR